jgi:hypothetical protein
LEASYRYNAVCIDRNIRHTKARAVSVQINGDAADNNNFGIIAIGTTGKFWSEEATYATQHHEDGRHFGAGIMPRRRLNNI